MENSSIYAIIAFYGLAITILGNAALVILMRNIVHSVLFLAVTFISMAGLFLMLDADFVAAIQVLVYAGAVCIMVVFAIMLIQRPDMKETNLFNNQMIAGSGIFVLVFALCAFLAGRTAWSDLVVAQAMPENTIHVIGELLMSRFVIPFEIVAVLLLVALIGAIVIARDEQVNEGVKADVHD